MSLAWVKDLHCFRRRDVIQGAVEKEKNLMAVKGLAGLDFRRKIWRQSMPTLIPVTRFQLRLVHSD